MMPNGGASVKGHFRHGSPLHLAQSCLGGKRGLDTQHSNSTWGMCKAGCVWYHDFQF